MNGAGILKSMGWWSKGSGLGHTRLRLHHLSAGNERGRTTAVATALEYLSVGFGIDDNQSLCKQSDLDVMQSRPITLRTRCDGRIMIVNVF